MSERRRFIDRRASRAIAASSLAAVVLTGSGCSNDKETETCRSPGTESSAYQGDPAADPDNQSTWKTGVLVTTKLHPEAQGLVVSYRHPDATAQTATSDVVASAQAEAVALRIGKGDVMFTIQAVALLGSAACAEQPEAVFNEPQPFEDLLQQGAASPPWPESDQ